MSKLNININKDDTVINDYLYCWDEMGTRPNKISMFDNYSCQGFINVIAQYESISCGVFTEVIPTSSEDSVVNEKTLVKLKDGLYLSYIEFDKLSDMAIVSEVGIIYGEDKDSVNELLSKLKGISSIQDEEDGDDGALLSVCITQNGIDIEPIPSLNIDYDNLDLYFEDSVIKSANKLVKKINKSDKGLSIIYGDKGTGKTSLVSYIASQLDKNSIFIPSTMIDYTINNPEFRNTFKKYSNSTFIIDDCDYFMSYDIKAGSFKENLLQLVDGLTSDQFKINFILIFNSNTDELFSDIECNNLIDIIEVNMLSKDKSSELSKHLGHKGKVKSKSKLIDIIKNKKVEEIEEIGY